MVINFNANDTKIPSNRGLVTEPQYDSDKQGLENNIEDVYKKIPNTNGLVQKTKHNTKITEIESKVPCITESVTTAMLNTKDRD